MSSRSQEQILSDLGSMLREFNGKEYSGEMSAKTRLFRDLGMVSIDAVILAETLERFYSHSFAFSQFLSDIGKKGNSDIEVGELASFLHSQMRGAAG
jgi:hypothetical protein